LTVKSVIDIEVNDEEFKKFNDLFQRYREQVKQMPEDWAGINKETSGTAGIFNELVAAMVAQAMLTKKLEESEEKRGRETRKTADSWKKMASDSKKFAVNIFDATKSLLRWVSATGIISGIIGAGGLFGIDRLAHDVADQRKYSLGLGTTPGAKKAFDIDYSRFVDPNSYLSGINESLHDITKRSSLYALGVSRQALQSGDTATVGSELLMKLKDLADRTNPAAYQQVIDARRLGGIVSVNDLERFHSMTKQELIDQQKRFEQDRRSLDLNKDLQRNWNDFSSQLGRAKVQIENAFVKGLAPLVQGPNGGALGQLSSSVATAITTLLTSIKPDDIKRLGRNIEDFSKFLVSPEFKQDIKDFAGDIHTLATAVADALHTMGKHSIRDAAILGGVGYLAAGPAGAAVGAAVGYGIGTMEDGRLVKNTAGQSLYDKMHRVEERYDQSDSFWNTNPNRKPRWWDPGSWRSKEPAVEAIEQKYNLPKNTLMAMWGVESDFGKNAGLSKAGAYGDFQFMPKTAISYGVDRTKFSSELEGAGHMLSDLIKHYKGNIAKALAAYNWGSGNVDRDIQKHGDKWKDFLPAETKGYLDKMARAANQIASSQGGKVKIEINNNTGGSAVVATNQAAH